MTEASSSAPIRADPRGATAASELTLGDEVRLEMVTLHAKVLQRMPLVELLLATGLGLAFYDKVSPSIFLAWAIPAVGIECVRALVATALLQNIETLEARRTHLGLVLMAATAGLADGMMAVLFMPRLDVIDQAVLGVVIFAIPAAGVAVSMSSRYILGAFAVAVILPATVTWAVLHPSHREAVLSLGLLYCGLLVVVAAESERLLSRAVMIRRERDQVVRDLERSNAEVLAAQRRAEDSAQARARVLAAASHDLRQPLHALSIYSAILAARPSPATLREVGENIDQIVRSLGHLLGGLLDLSRLSTGYLTPEKRSFALDTLLASICGEFRRPAEEKGLKLLTVLPPMAISSDQIMVGRIARNLIDNSIKYTERGSITVALLRRPDGIELSVTDTGKGIPLEEQQRVFEEFYQVDNPGRDRSKGVGLGLALVQRMTELIGARITVDSAPGDGSRFALFLPQASADEQEPEGRGPSAEAVELGDALIYVVDDEQDILNSMKTLLELWGARVRTAASAAAARSLFDDQGPPALLIADLRLGSGEHGTALARHLRSGWGHFPVLITTGETSSDALREATEAGYPLLHKPITAERLREAIGTAIRTLA